MIDGGLYIDIPASLQLVGFATSQIVYPTLYHPAGLPAGIDTIPVDGSSTAQILS